MLHHAKTQIAQLLTGLTELSESDIFSALEVPKMFEHGHLAFPVFALAKVQKKAPPVIAQALAEKLKGSPGLAQIQAVGGFLNFTFQDEVLQNILFDSLQTQGQKIGFTEFGHGKTVVIDFASPNVAKPMHVGHLRAMMIGQAVYNMAKSQGYNVIGINHLGDWGSQFGKLAWAYEAWGSEYDFNTKPMDSLLKLYVRFHEEMKTKPELETQGAAYFKKLESGDPQIQELWKRIVDYSLKDYARLYQILNVKHDQVLGESFYNDKMDEVVHRLQQKNLLKESEGAQVVFFDEKDNMPPCIIKKSDGASIYATRDLAAAIYRHEVQKADEILYVVGQDQILHFRQVFKVLEKMGYDWAKNCHHISFGMYRFKEGKMSTREGRMILFEDVIFQAIELVEKLIEEKNPNLENKKLAAQQIALGAVIFNDLLNDRVKNVDFDWDRILNFEGDSGPYVQYTTVRCKSLVRKYSKPVPERPPIVMSSLEERQLIYTLLRFQDSVAAAYRQYKPNILAQYLLDLCSAFSHFYHKNRILGEAAEVEASRMSLVSATEKILVQGLRLLNIEAPEAM